VSLQTLCIVFGILAALYAVYFFWVVLKYRGSNDGETTNTVGVLEPNDKGDNN
jgi:hypothetical protein